MTSSNFIYAQGSAVFSFYPVITQKFATIWVAAVVSWVREFCRKSSEFQSMPWVTFRHLCWNPMESCEISVRIGKNMSGPDNMNINTNLEDNYEYLDTVFQFSLRISATRIYHWLRQSLKKNTSSVIDSYATGWLKTLNISVKCDETPGPWA